MLWGFVLTRSKTKVSKKRPLPTIYKDLHHQVNNRSREIIKLLNMEMKPISENIPFHVKSSF